jgi:pyruvate/2-oxoglutarate dehydrogenase complex dihydrolipoamide dehydrogenase (E3) component
VDVSSASNVVIIGDGPGGYEGALVARQLGATVTLVGSDGIGGSAVLTDCVPSKTLVATAEAIAESAASGYLGVRIDGHPAEPADFGVDLAVVNTRVMELARAQSTGIERSLVEAGVQIVHGRGRLSAPDKVTIAGDSGAVDIHADFILIATGARPRVLPDALPDGERILTWEQIYRLDDLPPHLIVVGSGVTGAEFASAFHALGSEVTLVSSRDQVLPGQDTDAARVLEEVFERRGLRVRAKTRALGADRKDDTVIVTLDDGSTIEGSHVLMAVGSLPNTEDLGLEIAGVTVDDRGFIAVDRVSRTSARHIYAAGDCTGVNMLASVAAMQGRLAMYHALGDAVSPLDASAISSTIFTDPEIATVGLQERDLEQGEFRGEQILLPLRTNARAKMHGHRDGFVKLFARKGSRIVAGGVVVAPNASELIHSITLAVDNRLTVDQLAHAFTVYPSLSGSIAEAARRMHATQPPSSK